MINVIINKKIPWFSSLCCRFLAFPSKVSRKIHDTDIYIKTKYTHFCEYQCYLFWNTSYSTAKDQASSNSASREISCIFRWNDNQQNIRSIYYLSSEYFFLPYTISSIIWNCLCISISSHPWHFYVQLNIKDIIYYNT